MELQERFAAILEEARLLQNCSEVMLAISGGLDSVTMLDLFLTVRDSQALELAVCHVHHGIRGADADADLDFVKKLADRDGLRFYSMKIDALDYARERKLSLEEAARDLRYQAFEQVLQKSGFQKLATAHTANDQAETMLSHLFRGAGLAGMRGMRCMRGPYIRPLLSFTRRELEAYSVERGLSFREDVSNRDLRFRRNRIRHELLPLLEREVNPQVITSLTQAATILDEAEAFLKSQARQAFNSLVSLNEKNEIVLEIDRFLDYFIILKKYVLFHACSILSVDPRHFSFDKVTQLLEVIQGREIGKKVRIGEDHELLIDHDGIVIRRPSGAPKAIELNVGHQKSCCFACYTISWDVLEDRKTIGLQSDHRVEFVDFDKTGAEFLLRPAQPGDRFTPINFSGRKKVADYFSDKKIPVRHRATIPVLECPKGIVWICGHQIDDRFKLTSETRTVLKLQIDKAPR